MMGGVDPPASKPNNPKVDTTYQIAAGMQAMFPKSFVDAVTPYHTASVEDIKKGTYHDIVRNQILPMVMENKEFLSSIFGEGDVSKVISNMSQLHPLDAILRQSVEKGYSEDAIRMATKALSASTTFPDKKVTIAGASGGGFIVEEAIAILNELAKRYPELQKAISNIKGFAIGTPMANLTATSGGKKGEFAKFQAYIGTLDQVGKGFFGEPLYAGDNLSPDDDRLKELDRQFSLPGGILDPENDLQSVIQGWGYKHEVGKMLADLGKSASDFLILLSTFLAEQNVSAKNARKLFDVFNNVSNAKITDNLDAYITNLSSIIKEISTVNKFVVPS
jgi:hypothetical protein